MKTLKQYIHVCWEEALTFFTLLINGRWIDYHKVDNPSLQSSHAARPNLTVAYSRDAPGGREGNLEGAVKHGKQAVTDPNQQVKQQVLLQNWLQDNLVLANSSRVPGDQADDGEAAIEFYKRQLTACSWEASPGVWAAAHINLVAAYAARSRGDKGYNIECAIEHGDQALAVLTREDFPNEWAAAHINLANAYAERVRGDRADNLERAIGYSEQLLAALTGEAFSEERGKAQFNLALAYSKRVRGDRADNLERAIGCYEQALTALTRETFPQEWVTAQMGLGFAYHVRFRGDRANNLECAIGHYEQALTTLTQATSLKNWASVQGTLASAYLERVLGDRADNLERAIEHGERELEVLPREAVPHDWAIAQKKLGFAYSRRVRGDRANNLECAIEHYEQAHTVLTRDIFPHDWARLQMDLGFVYRTRLKGKWVDNLERAIRHYEQALEIFTRQDFPRDWTQVQLVLALAYGIRVRGDQADNVERSIEHGELALTTLSRDDFPYDWGGAHINLASAYSQRARGRYWAENWERAIEYYEKALAVITRETFPRDWSTVQTNLTIAYKYRGWGDRSDNLERAIEHGELALTVLTPETSPHNWAVALTRLGSAYCERVRGNRSENLDRAIQHYEQALTAVTRETSPQEWATAQISLAHAYWRHVRGDRADNVDRAIRHCQMVSAACARDAFPNIHRRAQCMLGKLYFEQKRWERSHFAYTSAISVNQDFLDGAYTEYGRRVEVGKNPDLFTDDAYALLRLGRFDEALMRLEQGKTRLLREALALAVADFMMLPEAERQAIQAAHQAVRGIEAEMRMPSDGPWRRSDRDLADQLRETRGDLRRRIEANRAHLPGFLPAGQELAEFLALIPEGGALVAPFFTTMGSAVFVLVGGTTTVKEEHVVELAQFTSMRLRAILTQWRTTYDKQLVDPEGWMAAIEAVGKTLWDELAGPVHERLGQLDVRPHAPLVIMPQGGIGLLPLHAAWRDVDGKKRYLFEDYTVSYVPGGFALRISCRRASEPHRYGRSLLAVINPTEDLVHAEAEGQVVADMFPVAEREVLVGPQATLEAVHEAIAMMNYIHIASHGFYDWMEPMNSALRLARNKSLVLADIIFQVELRAARLVTLSACETGLIDIRPQAVDEYLGLPGGFLQAGAPAVVSSLWPVDDRSTALLMQRFYACHLELGMSPAQALREAQLWLRDLSYEELAPLPSYADQKRKVSVVETRVRRGDQKPFSHPYYWAGFILTGT